MIGSGRARSRWLAGRTRDGGLTSEPEVGGPSRGPAGAGHRHFRVGVPVGLHSKCRSCVLIGESAGMPASTSGSLQTPGLQT